MVGRANAQDPQGWKRPWGHGRVGLRLKKQKGHRRALPAPVSEARGPHLGVQQASWARVGGANALLSSTAPLVWGPGGHLPPASPDLPEPMPPRTHTAWRGLWRAGDQLRSSAGSPARVGQAITLRSSPALPGESLPPASPDLPRLRGTDPVWPPLLLPSQSPYILPVPSGVPSISLGVRVPHQQLAVTLVVGKC